MQFDRKEFRSSLDYDFELRQTWKVVEFKYSVRYIGHIVSTIFVVLVVGVYVAI